MERMKIIAEDGAVDIWGEIVSYMFSVEHGKLKMYEWVRCVDCREGPILWIMNLEREVD